MPTPPKSEGGGPSIKLKVRATTPPPGSTSTKSPRKKRCFEPPPSIQDNHAEARNLKLFHQVSNISFVLHSPSSSVKSSWYAKGETCLYLVDARSSITTPVNVALHLRGNCQVSSVQVEGITENNYSSLSKVESSFFHMDPLQKVLRKPATSFNMDDVVSKTRRHEADSQSSRGATGMTNAIRGASIASNLGELRISTNYKPLPKDLKKEEEEKILQCWKQDLTRPLENGHAVARLREQLISRGSPRRDSRIDLVAKSLSSHEHRRALKVTVKYRILLGGDVVHFGGIHACSNNQTPHVYTTAGIFGDHEGPRSWIPTLDSASTDHRSSHDIHIKVTAPMREGLSIVGFGEDYGSTETLIHDFAASQENDNLSEELGGNHVQFLKDVLATKENQIVDSNSPHLIPPDPSNTTISIDALLATCVWNSSSWLPVPSRALGFAIGPFRALEDPEFFNILPENDKSEEVEKLRGELDEARENGEGIRHIYFAPAFARKYIHLEANSKLLPNTEFNFAPLTQRQKELLDSLDQSILTCTSGVPHRALSLMRDILALPTFRTVSFTQVWIPGAVHGGTTSGALHCCPEALVNPFLGGSVMDARLLPPVGHRLPFHQGGRVLQFLQARCAVRGWIIAALPLGGQDDVGEGYLHTLIENLIMSLYERAHGAHGEGGAKGGVFYTKRYSGGSGMNSNNLEFFPVQNIEEVDLDISVGSVIGAVPVEDRNNDQLWRSATNGTESHTSSMDEFAIRQLLCIDAVNALERVTDKGGNVPLPSMGWLGSHLSLSFLSSNATSSSDLGCGALELVHPTGGLPYRSLKSNLLRRVVEGRAGVSNFIRLVRAAFVAAHLDDSGHKELKYPPETNKKVAQSDKKVNKMEQTHSHEQPKPRFIVCVNEILKKRGLTHTLFTRALQNLAGRIREAQLLGTLVDVERQSNDPRTNLPFVDPEGFPNSYIRGASQIYLRVGVHVEPARDGPGGTGITKGIQMQSYAEPVIPTGGIAYGGPITIRVVENEGSFREFVKDLSTDGSRCDWGSLFLHAKPVTLPKAQTAASGIIESSGNNMKDLSKASAATTSRGVFTESNLHRGGYQAIELVRLTNLTPLLWVRVDPMGLYGGRISVFQPDACLGEMLFHDGDAGAQVEAMRALAERPFRIQGSVKITTVYDVNISELPVRLLGDCLRGSPALHSSLPHTPAVRAQAALSIAQWQNNKAPTTKNAVGANHWVGAHLLIQYFKERFYNNGLVMPVKMNRIVLRKENESLQAASNSDGVGPTTKRNDDTYDYLDSFEQGEVRAAVLEEVDEVEVEEDEEYRVRSAVLTALASVRAKDGMTPAFAVEFLESILDAADAEMVGNLVSPDEEVALGKKRRRLNEEDDDEESLDDLNDGIIPSMPYVSSMLVADALLALCHINVSPALITDPVTGKPVQSTAKHPVSKLMEISRRWLDWELYRERIRAEMESETLTGVSGASYDTIVVCAITALSSLSILRQSTTDDQGTLKKKLVITPKDSQAESAEKVRQNKLQEAATVAFYIEIFDSKPQRSDVIRAACAQAITCICCAADRFEKESERPVGLLFALEFILERILDAATSPGLRQTLAQLMLDACTGKICSMQRVGAIGGKNDLITSAARFLNGPLGASHGGDNGATAVTGVNGVSYPAASAVNDGARRGLRLMTRAGRDTGAGEVLITRIARFATTLWRTINGEPTTLSDNIPGHIDGSVGVCAYDGHLRCTLLCLFQWVWPKGCFAVMQVQAWKSHEGTQHYKNLGADLVMKTSIEEKEASQAEEKSLEVISNLVNVEIDRQVWRGEMAAKAYEFSKRVKTGDVDASAAEQGIGKPLPPIERDSAFLAGGWIASAAQQRRKLALDGGMAVTRLRLRTSGD